MASGGKSTVETWDAPASTPAYLYAALEDVGVREWLPGTGKAKKRSNPAVEHFAEVAAGVSINALTVPWCAYWIGAVLIENGLPGTGSGMARSYLKYGTQVDHAQPGGWEPGDILIFWRGRRDDGVTGHVAFFLEYDRRTGEILALGGNQGDEVSIERFSPRKLIGVRRPRTLASSKTVKGTTSAAVSESTRVIVDHTIPDLSALPTSVPVVPSSGEVTSFIDSIQQPMQTLAQFKPWISGALAAITLLSILYALYWRCRDFYSGRNA